MVSPGGTDNLGSILRDFNLECTLIIDPTRISFYNSPMVSFRRHLACMFSYCAGFFRPLTIRLLRSFDAYTDFSRFQF